MKSGISNPRRIEAFVRQLLGRQYLFLTPMDLLRQLSANFPEWDRKSLRHIIQQMVNEGILFYSHRFSSTEIQLATSAAPPISQRLILNDALSPVACDAEGFHLSLQDGSAFGRGDHPTTRLALRAIDWISKRPCRSRQVSSPDILDIGTGTGLLALAAVMLYGGSAIGLDIDYLSCCEAMVNVRKNGLSGKIHIVAGELAAIKPRPFDLVLSNLRPPTLAVLMPLLGRYIPPQGYWVMTGFRPDEKAGLLQRLPENLTVVWYRIDRNWAAAVVQSI